MTATAPAPQIEALRAHYRPILDTIAEGNLAREQARAFGYDQVRLLIDAGFSRLRIPVEDGGDGATLQQVFLLLADLAEADPNVAHVFRNHLAFVEDRLYNSPSVDSQVWLERFRRGDFVGGGWTEANSDSFTNVATRITTDGTTTRISGAKFYATGSLYANWLDVIGLDDDGHLVTALVARDQEGVTLIDDWSGFGQQTTASGSARYADAVVDPHGIFPVQDRFPYQGLFYQTALLSVLVGIGRAAFRDATAALRRRKRNYPLGLDPLPARDALLQQQIGHLAAKVFQASAALEVQAATLDVIADARARRDDAGQAAALEAATIRTHEAQSVIVDTVLEITTTAFDALGASATAVPLGLDRHWRNARTLSSHNPRVFKERVVGDFYVNGTPPPAGLPNAAGPQAQGQGV